MHCLGGLNFRNLGAALVQCLDTNTQKEAEITVIDDISGELQTA
jgi:hypothetical protein